MQGRVLDDHHYKGIDIYRDKSGEFEKNKEQVHLYLPPVIRKILQTSLGDQLNVLSVGSGNGAIDLEILKIVQAELQKDDNYRNVKIFNRSIEPCNHYISLYKKAIENLSHSLKCKIIFDIREQKFEEYIQETSHKEELATRFDLVHINQSIYYLDVEQTLKHCYEKELRENGQLAVVLEGNDIGVGAFLAYQQLLNVGKAPKSHLDEVMETVAKNGWKHEKFTQEYEMDVTEVFNEDSVQGNLLLDFMTGSVQSFRGTAEKAHIEKVLSEVQNYTVERGGRRIAKKIDVVLIISK